MPAEQYIPAWIRDAPDRRRRLELLDKLIEEGRLAYSETVFEEIHEQSLLLGRQQGAQTEAAKVLGLTATKVQTIVKRNPQLRRLLRGHKRITHSQ